MPNRGAGPAAAAGTYERKRSIQKLRYDSERLAGKWILRAESLNVSENRRPGCKLERQMRRARQTAAPRRAIVELSKAHKEICQPSRGAGRRIRLSVSVSIGWRRAPQIDRQIRAAQPDVALVSTRILGRITPPPLVAIANDGTTGEVADDAIKAPGM